MRNLLILALILCGLVPQKVRASDAEALVETLKKTAQSGDGINKEKQEIATKVQAVGAAAIPYLLPLLRDKNEDVRALVSYTLSDITGLKEQHLDALIESRARGDGWIPSAIARIGTPKAVTFLVGELIRERQTHTQVTGAIKMLGEKAVPELVQVYQQEKDWDDELEWVMFFVFKELGRNAIMAIDPLLKIASDEATSSKQRIRAITTVGSMGLPAERAVPTLQKLRQQNDKDIQAAAASAILNIGSAEAAPILVELLEHADDPFKKRPLLRDIAELKTRGKSAGSAVARFLNDDDWDVRVGAARALGCIGYEEAIDDLIKLLNEPHDWRLVLSAAESLGRMKAERALPALTQVAQDHWYPPVREAARKVVKTIRGGIIAESKDQAGDFPSEFFDYQHAGINMESLEREDAKFIQFPVDTTQDQPLTVAIKGKEGTVKHEQLRGVKVENGYLVGSDRGEWGGEILFLDLSGDSLIIEHENTEAIYSTTHGIVAVTGLAHMTMNSGLILKLDRGVDGKWTATKWRALPGAPKLSQLLKDGRLLVSCSGGIVLVSPEGEMMSLTRSQSLR